MLAQGSTLSIARKKEKTKTMAKLIPLQYVSVYLREQKVFRFATVLVHPHELVSSLVRPCHEIHVKSLFECFWFEFSTQLRISLGGVVYVQSNQAILRAR